MTQAIYFALTPDRDYFNGVFAVIRSIIRLIISASESAEIFHDID